MVEFRQGGVGELRETYAGVDFTVGWQYPMTPRVAAEILARGEMMQKCLNRGRAAIQEAVSASQEIIGEE